MTPDDRFMQYVQTVPWCGCWVWMGGRNFRIGAAGSPSHSPHKAAYFLFVGDPDDLVPVRECATDGCVNPDHHFLVDVSTAHSLKMASTNMRLTPEQRRVQAARAGTISNSRLSPEAMRTKMRAMRAAQSAVI